MLCSSPEIRWRRHRQLLSSGLLSESYVAPLLGPTCPDRWSGLEFSSEMKIVKSRVRRVTTSFLINNVHGCECFA